MKRERAQGCYSLCVCVWAGRPQLSLPTSEESSARVLVLLGPQDWWWQRGQEVPAVLLKRAAAQAPGQAYCQTHILHCGIL